MIKGKKVLTEAIKARFYYKTKFLLRDTSIYFGTQTGNAHMLAEELNNDLSELNLPCQVYDLQNFRDSFFEDLEKKKNVIFITACYGEGEPTDNAKDFFNFLMSNEAKEKNLQAINFGIFGLGNKTCFPERYQMVSKNIEKRLKEIGSNLIFPRGEGDSKTLDDDFLKWKNGIIPVIQSLQDPDVKVQEKEDAYKVTFVENAKARDFVLNDHDFTKDTDINNPMPLRVTTNEELTPKAKRSCKYIEFESNLKYDCGDHIGIYPHNDPDLVNRVCTRLNVDPNQQVEIETKDKSLPFESNRQTSVVTIFQLLAQYLSINHSPKPTFLKALSKLTDSEDEKNFLLNLCEHDENQTKFTNEIKNKFINVVDILEMLPNVKITFHQLFNLLPKMYPRYYSISSSGIVHPTRLHITVGALTVQTPKKLWKGLCSNYLVNLKPNDIIQAFVRVSNFKMPKDLLEPILFISGGTGIAPFIGFVEEREVLLAQGKKLGPCLLFFGVRDENYVSHKKLLEDSHSKGIITDMFIVYSDQKNGNEPPMFVSQKVVNESELVWKYLKNKTNIYICGGVSGFGSSVYNSLKTIIGKNTNESPQEYIDKMKKDGKCMEDLAD